MTTRTRFACWASLAGVIAVLVTGGVALLMIATSMLAPLDERLERRAQDLAGMRDVTRACQQVTSTAADIQQMQSLLVNGSERCRSSDAAPSPRALHVMGGTDGQANSSRPVTRTVVDGRWRVATWEVRRGDRVQVAVAAEDVEASLRARDDAVRATLMAMAGGVLLATIVGISAARPATRRIDLLLERIGAAGADPTGETRVGAVGGRDLNAAAASFDAMLDELRSADAMQRRLLAEAAHELRTPLTSIHANAQLLERIDTLDPEARDIAARITRQGAAVSRLVSGLVDFAAAAAWHGEHAAAHDLTELAQVAIERAEARWPDAQLELVTTPTAGGDPLRDVDAELVVRALGNLIDNAVVHGAGIVRVEVDANGLAVQDEGAGITGALAARAFEPFVGTASGGLGLAFVRQVAVAHGGTARIDPERPARIELRFSGNAQDSLR